MRYVTIENCFPRSSCMLSILSMPSRNSFIYKTSPELLYIFWWVFKAKATFFLFMALNRITFNVGLKWWKKEPLKADRGEKKEWTRERERELNMWTAFCNLFTLFWCNCFHGYFSFILSCWRETHRCHNFKFPGARYIIATAELLRVRKW